MRSNPWREQRALCPQAQVLSQWQVNLMGSEDPRSPPTPAQLYTAWLPRIALCGSVALSETRAGEGRGYCFRGHPETSLQRSLGMKSEVL